MNNKRKKQLMDEIIDRYGMDKDAIDEAWMRAYIYGGIEEREKCDAVKRVLEKNTIEKSFPAVFAKTLVVHMLKCSECSKYYGEWSAEKKDDNDRTKEPI